MKLVIITGTSRGLGLTLAQTFKDGDWEVIGTGRSERPAGLPQGTTYEQFDAGDAAACETFWQKVAAAHPDAEQICLVNNAGGYVSGSLTETTPEMYEQQMRSCFFTAVYMTRGLALHIPKARIINVISSSALAAHKNNSAYGAAKTAEMHFFQSLQREFEPTQYQITNLYPNNIASEGPNPAAMTTEDLSAFILDQATSGASYYLRDATLYPRP